MAKKLVPVAPSASSQGRVSSSSVRRSAMGQKILRLRESGRYGLGKSRARLAPTPHPNPPPQGGRRSEEHTSELQSLMRISYAVFCLKKKKQRERHKKTYDTNKHQKTRSLI